jgi:hypothetical protein
MLLFALCWLTLPRAFAPIERVVLGAACVLPHALCGFAGEPADAASPEVLARLHELAAELRAGVRAYDTAGAQRLVPAGFEPVVCAVVATGERRGGGGEPCELRLDRSHAELRDCCTFVTKGDALLGHLVRAGRGIAAEDAEDAPALVQLLNHPAARPTAGVLALDDGAALRMVVRAAAVVDPAALRVDLSDDPYLAARMERGGRPVRTMDLPGADADAPAGLLLGRTRIWGYERTASTEPLTIGVFVAPPVEVRALSYVVVWRRAEAEAPAAAAVEAAADGGPVGHGFLPALVWDLPGAATGRHLVAAEAAVPEGAAVVMDGLCLGTARGLAFGLGLVTSFPQSRHRWNLLLLPSEGERRPLELSGEVIEADGNVAWVRCRGAGLAEGGERLPAGYLFTGSNGRNCPAGLLLGTARPHRFTRDVLEVTTPVQDGPRRAAVVLAGGGR